MLQVTIFKNIYIHTMKQNSTYYQRDQEKLLGKVRNCYHQVNGKK